MENILRAIVIAALASVFIPAKPPCPIHLQNSRYEVCYSCEHKTPLSVTYEILREEVEGKRKRPSFSFHPDYRLPAKCRSYPKDYAGTGYDRGHLVPAGIFGGWKERKETFLMSNVAPQKPSVNRGVWAKIERFARIMAVRYGKVEVTTGVCFDGERNFIRRGVEIPDWWYKIVRIPVKEKPVIFLVPNKKIKKGRMRDSVSDYKTLERVCGPGRLTSRKSSGMAEYARKKEVVDAFRRGNNIRAAGEATGFLGDDSRTDAGRREDGA